MGLQTGCFLVVEVQGLGACPAVRRLSSVVAAEFEWASIGNGTGGKTERKNKNK